MGGSISQKCDGICIHSIRVSLFIVKITVSMYAVVWSIKRTKLFRFTSDVVVENCPQAWYRTFRRIFSVLNRCSELLLNWFLVYESIVCRHFVLRLYMTEESGEILSILE